MSKVNITLGCDPELVLIKDMAVIPACGLIGGTKKKPMLIEGTDTHIQEDGVMVEFNTPTANDPNTFWDISQRSLGDVRNFLYDKGYTHSLTPSAQYTKEQLVHEQAQIIGCDPDLLASLRGLERAPPTVKDLKNSRHCGGHIHIGFPNKGDGKGQIPGWVMIQLIEAGAYFPSMQYDNQAGRRKFYGLGGLYREKPYGVEYRTPSTFWLHQRSSSISFLENIWRVARWTCKNLTKAQELWEEIDFDGVKASIDSGKLDTELMHRTYETFQKHGAYGG